MITQEYINFFKELSANNHKEWFDKNRKRYEEHVRQPFIGLVESLIPGLMEIEASILPDAKKALFRINRDIRFSADKTPYNTMMKAGLSPGGKKSEFPGFYLGLGADNVHMGGGLYQLDKNALKNVRLIIAAHTDEFLSIINNPSFKKHFDKLQGDKNKRIDAEFQPVIERTNYILNKQFYAMATLPTSQFINESNQAEALMGVLQSGSASTFIFKQSLCMKKYMLIFRGQEGVDTSDNALRERIQQHINWIEKLGDQHIDSQRLEDVGAHILDHNTVETDGAFIEAKEIILGYTIIAAKDLDDAIFMAKTCPLLNYFEIMVRPVVS